MSTYLCCLCDSTHTLPLTHTKLLDSCVCFYLCGNSPSCWKQDYLLATSCPSHSLNIKLARANLFNKLVHPETQILLFIWKVILNPYDPSQVAVTRILPLYCSFWISFTLTVLSFRCKREWALRIGSTLQTLSHRIKSYSFETTSDKWMIFIFESL